MGISLDQLILLIKILTLDLVEILILKLRLNRDSEIVICFRFVNSDLNSTLGSVVPLAMFLSQYLHL